MYICMYVGVWQGAANSDSELWRTLRQGDRSHGEGRRAQPGRRLKEKGSRGSQKRARQVPFNSTCYVYTCIYTHSTILYIHMCMYILTVFVYVCMCMYPPSLVHTVTKNLSEHGEKLDDETKKTVQDAIDSAKALDSAASVETLKVG